MPQTRWQIITAIKFLPWGNITTPTVSRGKIFLTQGELLVITRKGILFISQTDLVKYFQMPVNASNLEKFPLFIPKVHPRVCWVICIILQLQSAAIEDAGIYTIDTINRINCINQYEGN